METRIANLEKRVLVMEKKNKANTQNYRDTFPTDEAGAISNDPIESIGDCGCTPNGQLRSICVMMVTFGKLIIQMQQEAITCADATTLNALGSITGTGLLNVCDAISHFCHHCQSLDEVDGKKIYFKTYPFSQAYFVFIRRGYARGAL